MKQYLIINGVCDTVTKFKYSEERFIFKFGVNNLAIKIKFK